MKGMEKAREIQAQKKDGTSHDWDAEDCDYNRPDPIPEPKPVSPTPPKVRAAHCTKNGVHFIDVSMYHSTPQSVM